MKRTLIALTPSEVLTLLGALRTLDGEHGLHGSEYRRIADLIKKIDAAPIVTRAEWKEFDDAAGEMLEAGADYAHKHVNVAACLRFAKAMQQLFPLPK